jgi:PAS domain-containing protein
MSYLPRPVLPLSAALLLCAPAPARAAGGIIFSGATVGAGIAVLVALCLLLATVHYRRRFTAAEARAADLEIQFERERSLLDTSPEAIVCWDTASGDQKLSAAAARMIGCAVTDSVGAEKIAALATGDSQAAVQTAVTDLIDAGKIFDEIVPGSRIRDAALCALRPGDRPGRPGSSCGSVTA